MLPLALLCVLQFAKIRTLSRGNKFSKLINSASIGGYYFWQQDGDIEEVSPALIHILNLRAGDENFSAICSEFGELKAELIAQVELLKSGKTQQMRFSGQIYVHKAQKEIKCVGCSVLDENNGSIAGVILWFFDMSEYLHKIKELALQKDRLTKEIRDYSLIFNTIPIPIWKRDGDFKITFCNFIYSKLVGSEGDHISNQKIPELDQSMQMLSLVARGYGKPLKMKKHLVINGERKFYNITEMEIKNSNEILGFAYDITDQDAIEKELARHISTHADFLEHSSSAVAVYSQDKKLRFYNDAFVKLWGLEVKWLAKNPTYAQIIKLLHERQKLPAQANFNKFAAEQVKLFQIVTKTQEDIMHLPDGKSLRVIIIPDALGGLLFVYEYIMPG